MKNIRKLTMLVIALVLTGQTQRIHSAESRPSPADKSALRFSQSDSSLKERVGRLFSRLPIRFEVNEGQADRQARFTARGDGYAILLAADEALMSVAGAMNESAKLRMRIVNANRDSKMEGLEELPGKSNYFIGNDPAKWRADVRAYRKARFLNAYPGIDVIYYGNQRRLEYDFVVAPKASASRIRLAFEGAKRLRIDEKGDLVLNTSIGEIRQRKPFAYQEIGGKRKEIAARYVMKAAGHIGFEVRDYDLSRPLVIDPVMSFSTYLGGSSGDFAYDVAVDSAGNVYATGLTFSIDFPMAAPLQSSDSDTRSAFVSKLNANGTALFYSTYLGGNGQDEGYGIAVDSNGNAYVTGRTFSKDFPTSNPLQPAHGGGDADAFAIKLDASGSALIYSTYLGDDGTDQGTDIAVDSSGSAFVTGSTTSSNFPTTPGAFQTTGIADAFIAKLDATGASLNYSTLLGGSNSDSALGIAIDSAGNACVAGVTRSIDFPLVSALQPNFKGSTFFKSSDGGDRWAALDNGLNRRSVRTIAVDPVTPSTIYACVFGLGIFKSTNGGATWFAANNGLPEVFTANEIVIDPVTPSTIYTTSGRGIHKTTDGGQSWTIINNELTGILKNAFAIDPTTPATIYAANNGGIYKSTDGGQNWNRLIIFGVSFIQTLAIDPSSPSTVYAGARSGRGVFKTVNGGTSWVPTALNDDSVVLLKVAPASSAIYAVTASRGMMKSVNGGARWDLTGSLPGPASALAIDPLDPATLYAVLTNQGLYKSENGGNRWKATSAAPLNRTVNAVAVDPKNSSVYAATSLPEEAFIAKLNSTGSAILFSTFFGGSGVDVARRVAVDSSGNIYVAGGTDSTDITTANATQSSFGGGSSDAFIAGVDAAGSRWIYSTYLGGGGSEVIQSLAVDLGGNVYAAGNTFSADFPTVRALQSTYGGDGDVFVTKLSAGGQAIVYSTYIGGSEYEIAHSITLDSECNAYVSGETFSANFPTTSGAFQATREDLANAFIFKIADPCPKITDVRIEGKTLSVTGSDFDDGTVILIDGKAQKTKRSGQTKLTSKKAGKKIAPGQQVFVQARSGSKAVSNALTYTRPAASVQYR